MDWTTVSVVMCIIDKGIDEVDNPSPIAEIQEWICLHFRS